MKQCAEISAVQPHSLAEELGLEVGDVISKINDKIITDLIRFQFEWAGEEVSLEIKKRTGEIEIYEIEKDYDESLGVVFNQAVFDGLKHCQNKCLFCFVDQMAPNLRKTLYIKDDDYRLSFLQGNFITLTNLQEKEIERIKKEHLSPLYVSVHTTNGSLRKKLLNNPKAGELLKILKDLSTAGIKMHTQVVLCPGLNDGEYLEQTYLDLKNIQGVESLAVVPVGLTKFRKNLTKIKTYTKGTALEIIEWAEKRQQDCRNTKNSSFLWLSDEFYQLAGKCVPAYEIYENFPQLENGIGMVRLLWHDFAQCELPEEVKPAKEFVVLTGVSGRYALQPIVKRLNEIKGLRVELLVVQNTFFGSTVTVTGLLTGGCLLEGLKSIKEGSTVLIPSVMLKTHEDKFLDDLTTAEVEEGLGKNIRLITVQTTAQDVIEKIKTS